MKIKANLISVLHYFSINSQTYKKGIDIKKRKTINVGK